MGYVFAPLMGLVLTEEKNAQYAPFLAYVILFSMASAVALRMEHHEKEVAGEGDDAEIVMGNDDEGENERMMGGASNTSSDTRRRIAPLKMKRTASFADFNDVSKRTFRVVTEPSAFLVFLLFLLMACLLYTSDAADE